MVLYRRMHLQLSRLTMKSSSPEILPGTLGDRVSLNSGMHNRATASLECPKCGKHTIVKRSPNQFDCLNCNFQKSLPPIAHLSKDSPYPTRPFGTTSNLYRLQQQASRAAAEQRYAPYEEDSKVPPLVFAAVAVIFGLILL